MKLIKIEKPKKSVWQESTCERTEAVAHSLRTYFIHGLIKSDRVVDKNLSTSESSVPGAEQMAENVSMIIHDNPQLRRIDSAADHLDGKAPDLAKEAASRQF